MQTHHSVQKQRNSGLMSLNFCLMRVRNRTETSYFSSPLKVKSKLLSLEDPSHQDCSPSGISQDLDSLKNKIMEFALKK